MKHRLRLSSGAILLISAPLLYFRSEQDNITQQIAIDGVIVAAFVYHIERTLPGTPPSVELVDFQKYKPQTRPRTLSPQVVTPPLSAHASSSSVASASGAANFHSNAFPGPLMAMDFANPAHPQPVSSLAEPFSFESTVAPSMYRSDSSPPQVTATSSASVIYGSPR